MVYGSFRSVTPRVWGTCRSPCLVLALGLQCEADSRLVPSCVELVAGGEGLELARECGYDPPGLEMAGLGGLGLEKGSAIGR